MNDSYLIITTMIPVSKPCWYIAAIILLVHPLTLERIRIILARRVRAENDQLFGIVAARLLLLGGVGDVRRAWRAWTGQPLRQKWCNSLGLIQLGVLAPGIGKTVWSDFLLKQND